MTPGVPKSLTRSGWSGLFSVWNAECGDARDWDIARKTFREPLEKLAARVASLIHVARSICSNVPARLTIYAADCPRLTNAHSAEVCTFVVADARRDP